MKFCDSQDIYVWHFSDKRCFLICLFFCYFTIHYRTYCHCFNDAKILRISSFGNTRTIFWQNSISDNINCLNIKRDRILFTCFNFMYTFKLEKLPINYTSTSNLYRSSSGIFVLKKIDDSCMSVSATIHHCDNL